MRNNREQPALPWINSVARGKRRYVALLILLQSVLGLFGVGYALMLQGIVNNAVSGNGEGLRQYALFSVFLVLSQAALRSVYRYLEEYTCAAMENSLKSRLFSALLTRDYGQVSAVHSGEWMNRLTSDTVLVARETAQIVPALAGMVIKMAAALTALVALEPGFGWLFLLGGLGLMLLTAAMRRNLKNLHRKVQSADGAVRVFLSERLGSLMTLRAFGKEAMTMAQAQDQMEGHKSARMKKSHFSNLCNTGLGLAMNGAYALGAVYCGYQILYGQMSYGTLTAVLQLVSQAQAPLANLSGFLPRYYAMIASAERLMEAEEFPAEESEALDLDIKEFYRDSFRGLELRNAGFTYQSGEDAPRVLRHLDLTIRKGDYVAFTGPSGCGKSTVLKLLMSLYPLNEGNRYVLTAQGERPLTAAWRGLFAYVPQGNQLMNGAIRDVVTFGDRPDQDEGIYRALQIACAEQFVRALPEGLDTQLGERGAGLSEGQMQRIAIARAIYSQRPILLLDESTSALDENTEKAVLRNLREMTDQTVIIVTHRPAVLDVVDREVKFNK